MTLDHDFYVVVGKQCRTENLYAGHQHNIFIHIYIYIFICLFKLVLEHSKNIF